MTMKFELLVDTTANVREAWIVTGESAEAVRARFEEDGIEAFPDAQFSHEMIDNEGDRDFADVAPFEGSDAAAQVQIDLLAKAAPVMLAALELAAERLEMNNYDHEEDESLATIRAAIAAAKGESI